VEPARVTPVPGEKNAWEVDGRATVDDLRDVGVPVGEEWAGEAVGHVVLEELGHLPRSGDVVRLAEGVIAEVIATSHRRIQRLRVRWAPEEAAAAT
jgi:CBS domain containing-hemolysin-like protein